MPQQHKKMLEQTDITDNEVCIIIQQGLENTETFFTRWRRNSWSKSISYSMSGLVSAQMGDHLAGIPSRRRNKHPGLLSVSLYPLWAGRMSTYGNLREGWEYTGTSRDTLAHMAVSQCLQSSWLNGLG